MPDDLLVLLRFEPSDVVLRAAEAARDRLLPWRLGRPTGSHHIDRHDLRGSEGRGLGSRPEDLCRDGRPAGRRQRRTTGQPKGVELTHFEIYMNADAHRQGFEMTKRRHHGRRRADVPYPRPVRRAQFDGAARRRATADGALSSRQDAESHPERQGDHFPWRSDDVPCAATAPALADYDTSSLRIAGSAGGALPAEFLDSFERKFGVIILDLHGLTESGPVATFNRRDDRKPYRVGKPIWAVDMQVRDVVRVPARHYQPIRLSHRSPESQ